MIETNSGEDLNLRLDFGEQAPELVFAVDQGKEGEKVAVVNGVLNGLQHLDTLIEEVIAKVENVLPEELLSDELKKKLAEQFRLGFYYLLQHP